MEMSVKCIDVDTYMHVIEMMCNSGMSTMTDVCMFLDLLRLLCFLYLKCQFVLQLSLQFFFCASMDVVCFS